MPTNKNAFLRMKILDGLLSESTVRRYTISKIVEICNGKLKEVGEDAVSRRCIEKDLEFIQEEFGMIERTRSGKNTIIHYADRTDSIFNQRISTSERKLLQAVARVVGQMDGLENFGFLGHLEESIENSERPSIIFEKNEFLSRRDLLPKLINFIESKKTIEMEYHPIHSKKRNKIELYPQLLKQYNARWFLFGLAMDKKKILSFSLEQLDDVKESSENFELCNIDWNEYFDDMIGVSKKDNEKPQEVIFWATKRESAYLNGKPIHSSQKMLKKDRSLELLRQYHVPDSDGNFFSINCIINFELKRELSEKFGELLVLEPGVLRDDIAGTVREMVRRYDCLNK